MSKFFVDSRIKVKEEHYSMGHIHSSLTSAVDQPQNRKKTFVYLTQAIFWIVIVLVGFELFLRFFIAGLTPVSLFTPDFGPRPVEGSVIKYEKEGSGIIHYSAYGEIATPFQGGTNVVVFGDSQTASYQVNDYQNYVSVAEKELHEKGISVDLHNFGYPSGTIADYVYWAAQTQSTFDSKIVVIQTSTNDFFGHAGREGFIISPVGNYFTKEPDNSLSLVHKPIEDNNAFYKPLMTKSSFMGYTIERLRLYRDIVQSDLQTSGDANKIDSANAVVSTNMHYIENYRDQITALHTAYKGQKVIIVYLPFSPIVSGNEVVLENGDSELLLKEIKQFDDWYVVDPTTEFQAMWLNEQKLPRGFSNSEPGIGHLNVDGHAIVGHLLAEAIKEVMK